MRNRHALPNDIDLVVGIPRSGLLSAAFFSLMENIPFTDIDSLIDGRIYSVGRTKLDQTPPKLLHQLRRILVLDDSINGGSAIREAREKLSSLQTPAEILFAAVYGTWSTYEDCDFVLEAVSQPRMFQWNFNHHKFLEQCCVDIDGVLCHDPTNLENDDGPGYLRFLADAKPLYKTSRRIKCLVTNRLEKYRAPTEDWLERHGIDYDDLVMLDLPTKEARQRQKYAGGFKAQVYGQSDAVLFIESESRQAMQIARISKKPVLDLERHRIEVRESVLRAGARNTVVHLPPRAKQIARNVLGGDVYQFLKARFK